MAGRVSQEVIEAEVLGTPKARVSQEVIEAEVTGTPNARVSQIVVEAEVKSTPLARVSQIVIEALVVSVNAVVGEIVEAANAVSVESATGTFQHAVVEAAAAVDTTNASVLQPSSDILENSPITDTVDAILVPVVRPLWMTIGGDIDDSIFPN